MYGLVSVFSYIIRQFFLPNPFSNLIKSVGLAEIVNIVFGGFLILISYFLTGTWYDGGTPAIGSIGFLFNYILLTYLFLFITMFFSNIYIVVILFLIGYIVLCKIENELFG